MFMQRCVERFPAAGEVIIFDRSWYNRAGVERVMGFVGEAEYERFLELCPQMEQYIVEGGIIVSRSGSRSDRTSRSGGFSPALAIPCANGN